MPQIIISVFMMISIVTLAIFLAPSSGQVTLSASTLEPIEGSQVKFICHKSGTNTIGTSVWKKDNSSIGSLSYGSTTNTCKVTGELLNETYITHCVSLVMTTITLTNVTFDLDNIPWTCSQAGNVSNAVTLTVQVPVSIVPNGLILTLQENVSKNITCATSFCRPQANVTWFISDGTGSHILLNGSNTSSNNDDTTNLVSTVSDLEVNFNRTYNEWMLVCEAVNIHGYTTVSRHITLNITYPTTVPKILCTINGKYKVIQNSMGNLTCAVDGGNPVGALHWNCTGDTALHTGSENTVSQSLVWNATQIQYCTCNSSNIAGSSSTTVMTDILYPPVINKMENRTVFEGDYVTLVCAITRANPPVYTIQWSSGIGIVANATLSIPKVSRSDDMTYSCTARNFMEPPCEVGEQGNTTRYLHLLVLYPPYVNISSDTTITINEGEMLKYTCPVVHGNPPSSNITWRRSSDTKTWNSAELIINATRYDDSVYTCYARNVMVNSSNITRIGNASAGIRIIVQSLYSPRGNSATIGAAGGSAAGLILIGLVIVGVIIFRRRMRNKPPDEPEASATLYVNVKNDNKSVVKHELNSLEVQTDQGIYENSELGKTENQSQKSSATKSSQSGEYVTFSKQKLAEMPKTRQEGLPMRTISPDTKATTQRSTASNLPPPIPSKTEFSGVLCKADDHEDDEGNNAHQTDVNIYGNSSEKIERIENVSVHELFAFIAGTSFESFAEEHLTLPKGLTMPCTVAVKPENIKLNRYNGIFPYDHSRVTIPEDPDFYINACYMDGYKKEKCYIASLGPTADTSSGFKTFWKMVWYEQSDIIIMVTNLRELTGMKCEQYWPKNGTSRVYGEVTVMCRNVEEYAEYTIRTFSVSKTSHNRTVTQLHFTAWPDKGVPDDLTSLLEFRQRLKSISNPESGPIVVHCSAGIGRTGTLIALDRLIAEGKATQSIHVSRCVRSMRQQRVNMVQTPEQYLYLYKACVYALAFECECISAETFHDKIKATTDAQFGELFTNLKPMVDNESDDEKKSILNHKQDKSNRPTADIAGDKYRIRLYVDKKSSDSDYTNAVYINSFEIKNRFIAAQTPLKDFVQDFICMIFQERCVCVLDMDGNTPSQLDVGVYVPAINQSFTFGNFTISCDKHYSNQKYTVNKMKIENKGKFYKGERTTYHFKYHDWKHGKETPSDPSDFVEFVKEVDEYATQFGERESHVLVHCLDASRRSGLFCFVACLLKKIQCEKEVNVGNTLRQVRTRRKTTIKNANQLKFCYKTVDSFIEMNKAK